MQIFNEEVYDLLAPSVAPRAALSVRDEGRRGVTVAGLTEHIVVSAESVAALLNSGARSRATASTNLNKHSSRSHAICTLTMEQTGQLQETGTSDSTIETRFSKFHLVDLAGSERVKRTHSQGARFKEGVNINRGLLSLGNVINALSEQSHSASSSGHVPYRDSKLTRLLQDSLGGNSKTIMIACVSPADINYEETANTLRYASRARNIENVAVINKETTQEDEIAELKRQVALLQLQLMQKSASNRTANSPSTEDHSDNAAQVLRLQSQLSLAISAKHKWKTIAEKLEATAKTSTSSCASVSKPVKLLQEAHTVENTPHRLPSRAPSPVTPGQSHVQLAKHLKTTVVNGSTKHAPQFDGKAERRRLHKEERERELISRQQQLQNQLKQYQLQKLASAREKESNTRKRKPTGPVVRERVPPPQAPKRPKVDTVLSPAETSKPQTAPSHTPIASAGREELRGCEQLLQQFISEQVVISDAKNTMRGCMNEREQLALAISNTENVENADRDTSAFEHLEAMVRDKSDEIREMQNQLANTESTRELPPQLLPAKPSVCHKLIRRLVESVVQAKTTVSKLEQKQRNLVRVEEQLAAQVIAREEAIASTALLIEDLRSEGGIADTVADRLTQIGALSVKAAESSQFERLSVENQVLIKEIQHLREQLASTAGQKKTPLVKRKRRESFSDDEFIFSDSDFEESDDEADSDYVEEESRASRRKPVGPRVTRKKSIAPKSDVSADETSEEMLNEVLPTSSPTCCSCKGKCATSACVCKSRARFCSDECKCNSEKCNNHERIELCANQTQAEKQTLAFHVMEGKENEVPGVAVNGV